MMQQQLFANRGHIHFDNIHFENNNEMTNAVVGTTFFVYGATTQSIIDWRERKRDRILEGKKDAFGDIQNHHVPVQNTTSISQEQRTTKAKDLGWHRVAEKAPLPTGMTLDYEQLQVHASGRISDIFGEEFLAQDDHAIQTRMPEPPLLLAHRMTGLQAEPLSMGKGTIWTESDVLEQSWYLHVGRMPARIMIESGQADLMLISYLGIDVITDGDRAYRLLGCELMYHDDLPQVGDTLCYDIHVDGHAKHGDVRLFFFHYDCRD